ncbi:MAG: hypothetical protein G8D28_07020 [gamma proteobacterium symbiont of Phacoides pectinatus]
MNRHTTEPDDRRISRLYRLGSREMPPPAVDAAIRQAARDAVTSSRLTPGWRYAATAMVGFLALGVLLRVLDVEPPPTTAPALEEAQLSGGSAPQKELRARQAPRPGAPRVEARTSLEGKAHRDIAADAPSTTAEAPSNVRSPAPQGQERAPREAADTEVAARTRQGLLQVPDCAAFTPPASGQYAAWSELAERLAAQSDPAALNCLKRAYRERFGVEFGPSR